MPKIKKSEFTNFLTAKTITYLEYLGCEAWRENNIAARNRKFFGRKGKADIGGLTMNGIAIYVEIKTPGDRMRKEQIEFKNAIEKKNGLYFIVTRYSDWEKIAEKLKYTNEENRLPETDRTEEEIRSYAERESKEICKKENEWSSVVEERKIAQNKKAKLKRKLKQISEKFHKAQREAKRAS